MNRITKFLLALALLALVGAESLEEDAAEMVEQDLEHEEEDTEDAAEDEAEEEQEEELLDNLSPEQLRAMHNKLDSNKDGMVTLKETLEFSENTRKHAAGKDIKALMGELDLDKNGMLSLEEFMKDMEHWQEDGDEDKADREKHEALEKAKFKMADTNGDGHLDVQEMHHLFYPDGHDGILELTAKANLEQKDLNKDGGVDLEEFIKDEPEDNEPATEEEKALFKKLDKDHNGKLDLAELKLWESNRFHAELAMKQLFELADKDKDGHLTAKELEDASEHIAGTDASVHLSEMAEHMEL